MPVPSGTRLALRDTGAAGAAWDGAWWPRSRLLVDELPGLIAALAGRYPAFAHVSYSLVFWNDAPQSLTVGGHTVRLGGSPAMNPYSLRLTGPAGAAAVNLLVVAPEADLALAARSLGVVAGDGAPLGWSAGTATAAATVARARPGRRRPRTVAASPERAWENEGGSTAR
jgi:hypothetical protein